MREKYDRRGKEGPKAPKDPALKRKGFYIMRRKQIAGSVQPDGRGIQFIYLDGGRMESFARITGNVTDEGVLGLLRTALTAIWGGSACIRHSAGRQGPGSAGACDGSCRRFIPPHGRWTIPV